MSVTLSPIEQGLVNTFEAARRRLGESPRPRLVWTWQAIVTALAPCGYFFVPAPVPDVMDREEARDYRDRLLDYLEARGSLGDYLMDAAYPIETEYGLYRLNGDGEPVYLRHDAPDLYQAARRVPCRN